MAPSLISISSRDIIINVYNSVFHYHAADAYGWLGFKGKGKGADDGKGKGHDGDDGDDDDAHDFGKGKGKGKGYDGDDNDDDAAHAFDKGKGKGKRPSDTNLRAFEEPAPETSLPKRPPPERPCR